MAADVAQEYCIETLIVSQNAHKELLHEIVGRRENNSIEHE